MDESREPIHRLIDRQARGIENDCDRATISNEILSARWENWNLWLGLASITAAVVAAFLAGSYPAIGPAGGPGTALAMVFACIAAVLTSALTFLLPSQKAGSYQQAANKNRALRNRIRMFRKISCAADADGDQLKREFQNILHEKAAIDSDQPVIPSWARDLGRKRWLQKQEQIAELLKRGVYDVQSLDVQEDSKR